jgi:hypothetical protein
MPADRANFTQLQFSTRGLPERDRLPMWREEFGRSMLHLDIDPLSDLPFHAEATLRVLPELRMVRCRGSAVRFRRTPAMVGNSEDSIGLVVSLGRSGTASQCGRDA